MSDECQPSKCQHCKRPHGQQRGWHQRCKRCLEQTCCTVHVRLQHHHTRSQRSRGPWAFKFEQFAHEWGSSGGVNAPAAVSAACSDVRFCGHTQLDLEERERNPRRRGLRRRCRCRASPRVQRFVGHEKSQEWDQKKRIGHCRFSPQHPASKLAADLVCAVGRRRRGHRSCDALHLSLIHI